MTTERIKVWPREGLLIRDEYSLQHIQPGDEVVKSRLVERHIAAGDLLTEAPVKNALHQVREAFPDQRKATGLKSEKGEG